MANTIYWLKSPKGLFYSAHIMQMQHTQISKKLAINLKLGNRKCTKALGISLLKLQSGYYY